MLALTALLLIISVLCLFIIVNKTGANSDILDKLDVTSLSAVSQTGHILDKVLLANSLLNTYKHIVNIAISILIIALGVLLLNLSKYGNILKGKLYLLPVIILVGLIVLLSIVLFALSIYMGLQKPHDIYENLNYIFYRRLWVLSYVPWIPFGLGIVGLLTGVNLMSLFKQLKA